MDSPDPQARGNDRLARMRRPSSCVLLFVFLCLSVLGCRKTQQSTSSEQVWVDTDYRFRLEKPGPRWVLLSADEVHRMVPDGVAGAAEIANDAGSGRHGAIVVEPAPGVELRPLAELLIEQMPLEDKKILGMDDIEFEKLKAVRSRVRGQIGGLDVLYQIIVFLNQGYAYQVLSWGLAAKTDVQALSEFHNAFHITEGPVRQRDTPPVLAERDSGWEVKDGVFRSATYGMMVRPSASWHLLVKDPLRRTNASAHVGLTSVNPEAYLIVLAERIGGSDRARFRDAQIESMATSLKLTPPAEGQPTTWKTQVAGREVEFRRFHRPGALPMEFLVGVTFFGEPPGDVGITLLGWYKTGLRERSMPIMVQAMGSISELPKAEVAALAQSQQSLPDGQNEVGLEYALRQGVYRDFHSGLTWRKPAGAVRISIGAQARERNKDASLFWEDSGAGIYGMLIAEDLGEMSEASYLNVVVSNMLAKGKARGRPEPFTIGDKKGQKIVFDQAEGDLTLRYHLAVIAHEKRGYQIMQWGLPSLVDAAKDRLQQHFAGFSLAPLTKVTKRGSEHVDHRFGFAFTPPGQPAAELRDITPPELSAVGTILESSTPRGKSLLLAICTGQGTFDEQTMIDLIQRAMNMEPSGFGILRRSELTADQLAGKPAQKLQLRRLGRVTGQVFVVRRDSTFYALAIDSIGGKALEDADVSALKNGLRFLD